MVSVLDPRTFVSIAGVMGVVLPGMLLGLVAISVPVLIHLIRSRKYDRVELGTLRFLRMAIQDQRRWRRIENWPLLVLRIGLITCLTFLFARPFLELREEIPPAELEALLLVDSSGSMNGIHSGKVREAIGTALATISSGAKITLAEFADDVRSADAGKIDGIRTIPGARTNYSRVVNWAVDHIAQSERNYSHIYFIGDLQRAGLPAVPPRVWPANANATVIPIIPAGSWNAAVANIELLNPYATEEADFEITVAVSENAPLRERELRFQADGIPEQKLSIPATGGRIRVKCETSGATLLRGNVMLDSDDAFPIDNVRHFAVQLLPRKQVLLIEGGDPVTPFDGPSYFLGKALSVSGQEYGPSPFASRVERGEPKLENADVIAFCDALEIGAKKTSELESFVKSGGGIAFFLGKNSLTEAIQPLVKAGLLPEGLAPLSLQAPRIIDTWAKRHPMLARFDQRDQSGLQNLVLRDAFSVEPGTEWDVLARLDNQRPVLLTRNLEKGRVLVFTNPLTREWSELPRTRIFLPLMKEWFTWLSRSDTPVNAPREVFVGMNEPRTAGVYERDGGGLDVILPDPQEMDAISVDEKTFREALGLPAPATVGSKASTTLLPRTSERSNEIWPWFAAGAILLMIFECKYADRKGRHSNEQTA